MDYDRSKSINPFRPTEICSLHAMSKDQKRSRKIKKLAKDQIKLILWPKSVAGSILAKCLPNLWLSAAQNWAYGDFNPVPNANCW